MLISPICKIAEFSVSLHKGGSRIYKRGGGGGGLTQGTNLLGRGVQSTLPPHAGTRGSGGMPPPPQENFEK